MSYTLARYHGPMLTDLDSLDRHLSTPVPQAAIRHIIFRLNSPYGGDLQTVWRQKLPAYCEVVLTHTSLH